MPPLIAKNLLDSFRRTAGRRKNNRVATIDIFHFLRRFAEKNINPKIEKARENL